MAWQASGERALSLFSPAGRSNLATRLCRGYSESIREQAASRRVSSRAIGCLV
jgi:hypothetical protein